MILKYFRTFKGTFGLLPKENNLSKDSLYGSNLHKSNSSVSRFNG